MLNPDQIAARKGRLTASRVAVLMNGDATGIMDLWRDMTDDPTFVPEDLSRVWPVQLGSATERLNLDWFEMKNGPVSRRGVVITHPNYEWAAATLDGWHDGLGCVIECKHTGGREPLEVVVERYQPQMQFQMTLAGCNQCALSVIMGAAEPIVEFIPFAPDYAAEMMRRGEQFMSFVRRRVPPVVLERLPAPIPASRVYDMTGSNVWAAAAAEWLETRADAERCKIAEKTLKAQVPEDAVKCTGAGIRITRDRVGRLSLREEKA